MLKGRFWVLYRIPKKFIIAAFLVKCLSGIFLTYIYAVYYPDRNLADTFRYFDDAQHLHKALFENPSAYFRMLLGSDDGPELMPYLDQMNNWFPAERTTFYNDNRTVIRLNAIIRLFSFGNYYVHLLTFGTLAFAGFALLYKSIFLLFEKKEKWLFVWLFFMPSALFWSSGIMKEGPLLLLFSLTILVIEKLIHKPNKTLWSIILALLFIGLFHLKFYVGVMLIPAITFYWWIVKGDQLKKRWKFLINYAAYLLLAVVWDIIYHNWSLFMVLKWKRNDFLGLAKLMDAKSLIYTGNLEDTPLSFLLHVPLGLFNTLFRPSLLDIYAPIISLAAFENTLILIMIVVTLLFFKKSKNPQAYFWMAYALTFFSIIGMVTPIMGSLVRYKIPGLLLFGCSLIMFLDIEKLSKKMNSIFKR